MKAVAIGARAPNVYTQWSLRMGGRLRNGKDAMAEPRRGQEMRPYLRRLRQGMSPGESGRPISYIGRYTPRDATVCHGRRKGKRGQTLRPIFR